MLYRLAAICAPLVCLFATSALHAQTIENAILDRINVIRANPRAYADQLRIYRSYFDGEIVYMPGDDGGILTKEGVAVVEETIAFLEAQAPLPPLAPGTVLTLTAADYSREQGLLGARGHVGPDGSSPGERVKRHGGGIFVGEAIAYGFDDPEEVVRQMVIDDGVPDRGHRKLLFDKNFRFAGVGCAPHARLDHICVVQLSATQDGRPVRLRTAQRR
ncbi:CAP domain-containing protein [Sphingomonas elodea]|uniref:CAP domain-containing protein n=1 Tax=Sphingomonas elodea TaxID=179878 RepID=UPI00026306F1|nr:CAP domain-containing protein [Sphingomonas elodea]